MMGKRASFLLPFCLASCFPSGRLAVAFIAAPQITVDRPRGSSWKNWDSLPGHRDADANDSVPDQSDNYGRMEDGKSSSLEEIGGAAVAGTLVGLWQGGSLPVSGAAGLGAALLALTRGPPGAAARQVGDLAWTVGRRLVRLSEEAVVAGPVVNVVQSATVATQQLIVDNKNEDATDQRQPISAEDDLLRNLENLRLDIYAFGDECNRELETLEMESVESYDEELNRLQRQVKQMMQETQGERGP